MSKRFELDEDFVGAFVSGGLLHTRSGAWLIGGIGTPAVTMRVSEDNAPGIVRIATSATLNDVASLILGMNTVCAADEIVELSFRFRPFGTLDTSILLGVFDDATLPGTVARYMLYDTSGPDFITSVSAESGSDLITTTVAPDGVGFNTVTFRKTGDGALASVTITDEDGVIIARGVHDAEFPDGTQVFFILQVTTLTPASRGVDIDRVTLRTGELVR
jgi:hypothetical protein